MKQLKKFLQEHQSYLEKTLDKWLPSPNTQPEHLHEAMRYTTLSKGKRMRPILVYAAGKAFGVRRSALDAPACAVEMIHSYSLIHDDLPAMDNDDLRRGLPACHKAYDEATAILTGDSLCALAFHILAHDNNMIITAQKRIQMIDILAHASGSRGMAGGQAMDLASAGKSLNIAELENMHIHKTGALIKGSVELGALSQPSLNLKAFNNISHYAKCIGLAFQVQDDILDIESDTETLGKPQGSDVKQNKPTYPNLLGLDGAKDVANQLYEDAISSLAMFDEKADPLRWIAGYIVQRDK